MSLEAGSPEAAEIGHFEAQGWRAVWGSVQGIAHQHTGVPCQDASGLAWQAGKLVAVMSDGAGSAQYAQQASQMCVEQTLAWMHERLQQPVPLLQADATDLLHHLRTQLDAQATAHEVTLREWACTLCVLVLGEAEGWYCQVGDGVAVLQRTPQAPLGLIFAPDNGEYANQTLFVGDVPPERIHCQVLHGPFVRAALLTDGLQHIGLQLGQQMPHAPFFLPILSTLEQADSSAAVAKELGQFLHSDAVNARVDDDKTLMLLVQTSG